MIRFQQRGDFGKLNSFLERGKSALKLSELDNYCHRGVSALSAATPERSGLTAASWSYEIKRGKNDITITFTNTHIVKGVPIAIILQYGHGTGTGGYVQGQDYINPAIKPIFDQIAEYARKEVIGV